VENAITVRSVAEEITALRNSLDNLEQLVGLEQRYIQRTQERDRLYRLVLDCTRDWIICFDQQGVVQDANQAVAEALACNEYDLVGKRIHEFRLQRRVADSWELCRRAAAKPEAFVEHEVSGVFPDGRTYALQTFFRPVDDGRGNLTGVIMVGRDINGGSPNVHAESTQPTLEQALIREFTAIAYRGDPGQRFSSVHGCVMEITGYDSEELLDLAWESIVHPDDRLGLLAAYELLRSSPEMTLEQEYRILTKAGNWRWVREVVRTLHDPQGMPIAAEGIIQDIHSRKQAEQALQQLATLFGKVLTPESGPIQVLQPGKLEFMPEALPIMEQAGISLCYQRLGFKTSCQECAAQKACVSHQTEVCSVQVGDRMLECSAHPVLDEQDNPSFVLQRLQDVTLETKQIQQTEARAAQLAALLDVLPQAVLVINEQRRVVYMNACTRETIGDHAGHACFELLGNSEPCADCPLQALFAGELAEYPYNLRCYGKKLSGKARRMVLAGEPGIVLSLTDETESVAAERRNEYYQAAAEGQRDMLLVTDALGNILEVNRAAEQVYGWSAAELTRMKLADLGEMTSLPSTPTIAQMDTGVTFETIHRKRDGAIFPVEVSAQWATVDGQLVALNLVRDISNQKAQMQALVNAGMRDTLTGLYNRACQSRIEDLLKKESSYPLSVIMGDVNGLKLTNNAFGYAAGDELIKAVAHSLQSNCLRASDMAIRWGGDEFVLILPSTSSEAAALVCERVRQAASSMQDVIVAPSAAWGIATVPSPGPSLSMLLKQAEERMQRNKLLEGHKTRVEIIAALHHRLQQQALETLEHTNRVQNLAMVIGRLAGLSEDELQRLTQLAMLHDLGKVAVPESILQKPGQLSKEEWSAIERHPEVGYRIASSVPELMQISDEILGHHERWDGTGYPRRLRGEEIPLLARIVAIADAYAVMTSGRPYREALGHLAAAGELVRCAGTQFDPRLVRLFVNQHGLVEAAAGEDN
jgi:diguanylate cyclase (GGDEF)-like protein/PAS domain S-box-containing protein